MTPTNELRFVERIKNQQINGALTINGMIIRVLQQKWVRYWSEEMGGGEREWEWRDVPCVKEEA